MEQPLAVNAENSRAKVQNVGGDSSEKILGTEGCSRLGQSDSEPDDIVDQA